MKPVRCAIYTRKSSEEGLEQDFNSLDAQREACAAYVLSQASEGWTALSDRYDDGGLSGGTLERPALKRLLEDVASGRVDIIVVYKVDRLTRSLLDFSKLVEAFDKAGVSFVSVTQSFNTTTSMGRLTLNMLLSFAQFEREVTAERIRDKIAASKAKGMWMGGIPPIGYEPDGRSLRLVPEHAAIVQQIFEFYLEHRNVRLVAAELRRRGMLSPARRTITGRDYGGGPFTRGQLYLVLKCPTYVGDVVHRGQTYAGRHEAITDRETWAQTQAALADNTRGRRGSRAASPSLLAGKIVDAAGMPLISSHACKGARRYRYYVSREDEEGGPAPRMRLPALEVETAVAHRLAAAFDDFPGLCAEAGLRVGVTVLADAVHRAAECAARLRRRDRTMMREIVEQVVVVDRGLKITCSVATLAGILNAEAEAGETTITLLSEAQVRRSGRAVRLVHSSGMTAGGEADQALVRLLGRARRWWQVFKEGELDVTALAAREGVTASYLTRIVRLAFLSPAVVDAIISGRTRAGIDATALTGPGCVTARWTEQARKALPAMAVD